MIGIVHHKLYACCNLAELTDNKFVSAPGIEIRNVMFELGIRNVSKISNNDIGIVIVGFTYISLSYPAIG